MGFETLQTKRRGTYLVLAVKARQLIALKAGRQLSKTIVNKKQIKTIILCSQKENVLDNDQTIYERASC